MKFAKIHLLKIIFSPVLPLCYSDFSYNINIEEHSKVKNSKT